MSEKRSRGVIDIQPFWPGDPSLFVFPSQWGGKLRAAQPCGIGSVIEVEVPGRLHASVLDMNRFGVGLPGGGGIGFAVGIYSRVRLEITSGLGVSAQGNRAAMGSHLAELFQAMMDSDMGMNIEAFDHGYQHVGVGSSVGVMTALMVALNEAFGRPLRLRDLRKCIAYNYCEEAHDEAGRLVRGFETNIGAMVGIHGGMVVGTDGCELICRIGLPPAMRILLLLPTLVPEVASGDNEAEALLNVAQVYDRTAAEQKAYRVLMDLLPAMKRADMRAIGQIIYELAHVGSKRAECCLHGNSGEEIYAVIDKLRDQGAEIVCMSSVGPAVFAMSENPEVWDGWQTWCDDEPLREISVFPIDNTGVRVRIDGIPVTYHSEPWWD